MKKSKLEALIKILKGYEDTQNYENQAAKAVATAQVERLISDLENQYLAKYDELSNAYRGAWDEAVKSRLDVNLNPTLNHNLRKFRLAWINDAKFTGIAHIHFGQMRIAANFANAANVAQQALGVDQLAGRTLAEVATDIQNGVIARDEIPVQIFLHGNVWVAINNRGFACHCIANVRPLRLFPRDPEAVESNRLTEAAPAFTYANGVAHLTQNPRTLPSKEMPITAGPNSVHVSRVVTTVAP